MALVILLIIGGLALIFLETILPGLICGIIGFGCLVAAVVISYSDLGPGVGNYVLIGVLAALVIGAILWLKYFPQSRLGKLFVSESTVGNSSTDFSTLVSSEGIAHTALRPSGTALIDGKRFDVVSEGGFIERDTAIKVVKVEGTRIVVRAKT